MSAAVAGALANGIRSVWSGILLILMIVVRDEEVSQSALWIRCRVQLRKTFTFFKHFT